MSAARQVLAVRDFRRLLIGQGVSGLGDWMLTFTLMALIEERYDSASAVAGVLALRLLPAAVGGGMAGRLARHWDRRKSMLVLDYVRIVVCAVIPLSLQLWWLYLWAVALEVFGIIFLSARDSSIPDLSEPANLPVANGMMLGSSFGAIPLGAGLFSLLSLLPFAEGSWFGASYAVIFWIDAFTYLVSALMISRMAPLGRPLGHDPEKPAGRVIDALRHPLVRSVIGATCAVAIGLGALFPLGIALVKDELGATDSQFGVLVVLFGAGAVIGLFFIARLRFSLLTLTKAGVLVMGALVAGMSLSTMLWLILIGAVVFGAAATTTLTSGMSALQTSTQDSERQAAFGVFHMIIRSGLGLAAVLAGLIVDLIDEVSIGDWRLTGTRLVLLISGIVVVAGAFTVRTGKAEAYLHPRPTPQAPGPTGTNHPAGDSGPEEGR